MVELWQTGVAPVIMPGWAGVTVTETPRVLEVLVPHELVAVTEIVPPVATAVAVIDVEVELPLQPGGKVHV